jgi:hypothetical protein
LVSLKKILNDHIWIKTNYASKNIYIYLLREQHVFIMTYYPINVHMCIMFIEVRIHCYMIIYVCITFFSESTCSVVVVTSRPG